MFVRWVWKRITAMPNHSVHTDAPCVALRARTGSPVTFVR